MVIISVHVAYLYVRTNLSTAPDCIISVHVAYLYVRTNLSTAPDCLFLA